MWQKLITPPNIEPVTLAQAKLHARVDEDADDSLVTAQIIAARQLVESYINNALITQTWQVGYDLRDQPFKDLFRVITTVDTFPYFAQSAAARQLEMPFGQVQSIGSVNTYQSDNTEVLFASSNYRLSENWIKLNDAAYWPTDMRSTDCVIVEYDCGYGDTADDVPNPIKQAILMLISHWYENRGAVYDPMNVSQTPGQLPYSVSALLQPYRTFYI